MPLRIVLFVAAATLMMTACIGQPPSKTSIAVTVQPSRQTSTSPSPPQQLIVGNRLALAATYGDEPTEFLPPPASATVTITSAQAVDLYSRAAVSGVQLADDFDYALAQLARPMWGTTVAGQLVWLIVNHHQHEISSGPADMDPKLRADLQAADQDTVTVVDAMTGRGIVQAGLNRLHAV